MTDLYVPLRECLNPHQDADLFECENCQERWQGGWEDGCPRKCREKALARAERPPMHPAVMRFLDEDRRTRDLIVNDSGTEGERSAA